MGCYIKPFALSYGGEHLQRCNTKYPILLLHGMGFHDRLPIHYYWGRIPRVLRKHGASVYFGDQDGNATTMHNARQLVSVIHRILDETGAEKINIIAHSKGGLEARYLVSSLGMGDVIASVTTISTPHNGSITVDRLLEKFPHIIQFGSAVTDLGRRCLGDRNPHTFRVINQFTTDYMHRFNKRNPDDPRVFYQSYAFVMERPLSDPVMAIPNAIVNWFEGENDGLLTPRNAQWTNFRGVYRGTTGRGISHPDETDYRQMHFTRKQPNGAHEISDMAQFYLGIAEDLKRRGF